MLLFYYRPQQVANVRYHLDLQLTEGCNKYRGSSVCHFSVVHGQASHVFLDFVGIGWYWGAVNEIENSWFIFILR